MCRNFALFHPLFTDSSKTLFAHYCIMLFRPVPIPVLANFSKLYTKYYRWHYVLNIACRQQWHWVNPLLSRMLANIGKSRSRRRDLRRCSEQVRPAAGKLRLSLCGTGLVVTTGTQWGSAERFVFWSAPQKKRCNKAVRRCAVCSRFRHCRN